MEVFLCIFILHISYPLCQIGAMNIDNLTHKGLLDSLKYQDKLIFDFTHKPINEILDSRTPRIKPVFGQLNLFKFEYPGVKFPMPLNFTTEDPILSQLLKYPGISQNFVYFLIDFGEQNPTDKFSFPKKSNEMLEFLSKENKQFTLIFSFYRKNLIKTKDVYQNQIKLFIKTFKQNWKHVKIGMFNSFYPVGNLLDVLILNEKHFSQFSSSDFHRFVKTSLKDYNVEKMNLKFECEIYIRLELPKAIGSYGSVGFNEEEWQRFYHLVLKSSLIWINSGEKVGLVLQGFDEKTGLTNYFEKSSMAEFVMPSGLVEQSKDFPDNACALKSYMEMGATIFKNILQMNDYSWDGMKKLCVLLNSSCGEMCLNQSTLSVILTGNDVEEMNNSLADFVTEISSKLEGLELKTFAFSLHEVWENVGVFSKSVNSPPNFLKNITRLLPNVSFACSWVPYKFPPKHDNFNKYRTLCKHYWNHVDLLIWKKLIKIREESTKLWNPEHSQDLVRKLTALKDETYRYPDKTVILDLKLLYGMGYQNSLREHLSNLHCDSKIKFFNEQAEIIINFAQVFNFRVAFKPAFGEEGWWQPIRTVEELKPLAKTSPYFTARNYPVNPLLPGIATDPCVKITREIPQEGLPIDLHFSGTTFYFPNNFTSEYALWNMFSLISHRFSLIELFPVTKADLKFLLLFLKKYQGFQKDLKLYLRINCELSQEQNVQLNGTGIKGIHFANCKETPKIELYNTKLGLSLDNCLDHVLTKFKNISKVLNMDYIVCNISTKENIQSSNWNVQKVEKYLDSLLYIKKYFHRLFPTLEVIFRINHHPLRVNTESVAYNAQVPNDTDSTDNFITGHFLRFLGDANQYALFNKIKIFMVPAFDSENGQRYGWWKITDFKSLDNSSVFVEKESAFLGKETWRPPVSHSGSRTTLQNLLIWSVILLLILFLLVTLIYQYFQIRKYSYLNKSQVKLYIQGEDGTSIEKLPFPKGFELQKKEILLINILGKGNFGVVYKGKLYSLKNNAESEEDVAVKMPLPGCPKDSFLSLLSELKALCYVGVHQNVLKFIGGYVKNIGKGEVQIVAEYCENGSLLEYLRRLAASLHSKENVDNVNVNEYELARFCHEIAQGMEHLRRQKVIHGDLSARNILLNGNFTCKIADFGLSRKIREYDECIKKGEEPLPWRWMALESLKSKEFSVKSDVWSFGVTCWEIYTLGCTPYPCQRYNEDFLDFLENGNRLAKPNHSTDAIYETLLNCWKVAAEERPTFAQLIDFFIGLRDSNYSRFLPTRIENKGENPEDKQLEVDETSL